MDNFYEQLLPAKKASFYKVINALAYIFCVLAFAALAMGCIVFYLGFKELAIWLSISCLACVVVSAISFIIKKKLFIEYEYEFTNGNIDIDVIYEMKSRKTLMSFDIKDIELMALESSNYIKDFTNDFDKKEHFYTNTSKNDVYALIIKTEGKLTKILFTPDNKFAELCSKYNSKAVKI